MSKIIKIEVNQELVNYIQRLHFEKETRQEVIRTLIENHQNDIDASVLESSAFKTYSEQLSATTMEYELAKQEMSNQFVPECLANHQYEWNLDFGANELRITVHCDCGIAAIEEYLKNCDTTNIIIQDGE